MWRPSNCAIANTQHTCFQVLQQLVQLCRGGEGHWQALSLSFAHECVLARTPTRTRCTHARTDSHTHTHVHTHAHTPTGKLSLPVAGTGAKTTMIDPRDVGLAAAAILQQPVDGLAPFLAARRLEVRDEAGRYSRCLRIRPAGR